MELLNVIVWLTGTLVPFLSVVVPNANATFVEVPTSLNVSLGSTAIFNCTVHGLAIVWLVDGVSAAQHFSNGISSDYIYGPSNKIRSTLDVLATKENNNTKIVCKVLVSSGNIKSDPAYLTVQGLLSAPSGLNAHYQNATSSIVVNWDKPFTINITATEPDIQQYTVYIINVNTGTEEAINLTETNHVFRPETDPDPCHIYEFSVSARNMVGEGERSERVTAHFIVAPPQVGHDSLNASVIFHSSVPQIKLKVQMLTIVCIGEKWENLSIKAWSIQQRTGQKITTSLSASEVEGTEAILELTLELPSNDTYTVVVIPENIAGGLNPIGYIKISTFDVQAAYASITMGEVCITCYFAQGSAAVGCYAILYTPEGRIMDKFTAIRNSSTDNSTKSCHGIADPAHSVFSCKVFDVEHDGEIGKQPAYTLERVPVTSGSKPCVCVNTSTVRVLADVSSQPQSQDVNATTYPEECSTIQEDHITIGDKEHIILASVGVASLILLVIVVLTTVVLAVLHKRKGCKKKTIVMRSNAAYERCTITRNR